MEDIRTVSVQKTRRSEQDRLDALARYDILDTPFEEQFDDIVKLASQICDAPISLISLVEKDRQWFKAEHGLGARETSIDVSVCKYAILQDEILQIPDATKDARFADNPLVTGAPYIKFYAGAVLETPEGVPLGTLCVLDRQPRELNEQQLFALKILARQVMAQLELRRSLREQRDIAAAADEAREHYALMVDSAEDYAIISIDTKGLIVSWNKGAQRIFGYTRAEVMNLPINLIFTSEDIFHDVPSYELHLAGEQGKASDERWHLRKNGERFYASGIMAAMKNSLGEVTGYIKIARDMTLQQQSQELMIEARNAAEAANIAKTEFLANMSHEIRTPMNAVIGLSNILAMTEPLTNKQREFIKTLQMSADSLLSLINDLLDIAKIEARTVDLENVPFSLDRLIQEVISMMGVRIREKGLQFTADTSCTENRMFMGDPTRLRQIILNLCSNAIKFTNQGSVHIVIHCADNNASGQSLINLSVTDTGIGIAEEKLNTIFHKFVQADSSINRKYGGTGLGLAITKTLTEIMGGELTVESKVGIGSTFTVSIPFEIAESDDVQKFEGSLDKIIETAIATSTQAQPCILLVEDYAPNILVAGTFLEGFGFSYDVANNGVEAIDRIKDKRYAAVLMDVQMHGMNGLEATRLIRENERQTKKPPLTIIGMTAHALTGDRERCIEAGMDDYITKPFNPDELEKKILAAITAEQELFRELAELTV